MQRVGGETERERTKQKPRLPKSQSAEKAGHRHGPTEWSQFPLTAQFHPYFKIKPRLFP